MVNQHNYEPVLDRETLAKLYRQGYSQTEIAEAYGSSQATIQRLMVAYGIATRATGRNYERADLKRLKRVRRKKNG